MSTKSNEPGSPPLGLNAQRVVAKRYARKDPKGQPLEQWTDIVYRVVNHVAQAEKDKNARDSFATAATQMLLAREFIPNTPCLVNAGRPDGQLAACFVLDVPDSIVGIMKTAGDAAVVHKTGGGTGFTFEKLRPAGATVRSTHGVASGPVSFMEIFNTTTETIKQGGVRRGANMGMLRVTHPDILRFIHAKNDQSSLTNFNISVNLTDAFLQAVDRNQWFQLEFNGQPWDQPIFDPVTESDYVLYRRDGASLTFPDREAFRNTPLSGCAVEQPPRPGMIYAPDIWNRIVASAHRYAEPGIAFIDEVNRHNQLTASMGPIWSCNPCGEQFLHFGNSCNLGSLDVSRFYDAHKHAVNFHALARAIHDAVRFLDNVIDVCAWPLPEIKDVVKRTRPVGLGIMGFADLCLKLQVTYGSDKSIELMEKLMSFMRREAWRVSLALGRLKGTFPELEANRDAYAKLLYEEIAIATTTALTPRNYEVTTIAPTGTISLVAETSSGIEPNFSWAHVRQDTVGTRTYVHSLAAKTLGLEVDQSDERSIAEAATYVLEHERELPPWFVTAMSLSAEQHVRLLAAAQRNVDNSVSKRRWRNSGINVERPGADCRPIQFPDSRSVR